MSSDDSAMMHSERSAFTLLNAVRRRKILTGGIITAALAGSLLLANLLPATYTADTLVIINPSKSQVTNFDNLVTGSPAADPALVRSELNIIQSRAIAGRVVDRLDLVSDPEFNPALRKHTLPFLLELEAGWTWLANSLKSDKTQQLADVAEARTDPKSSAARMMTISRVMKALTASNDGRSYSIDVGFTSRDPAKAASIANAFAQEYLKSQIDAKSEATRRANEWLGSRVAELRQEVQQADQETQRFRDQNNLTRSEPNGTTPASQQMQEMTTQLVAAETARGAAEARLRRAREQVRSNGGNSVPEVLASPLIQFLKQEQATLSRRVAELSEAYGDNYPQMKNARAELSEINRKIKMETDKVIAAMADDLQSAQLRVDALRARLNDFRSSVHATDRVRIKLQELESTAEAKRTLLKTLSERYEQTSALQNMLQPDAQVIGAAEVPALPSGPNKIVIVGLALLGSVVIVGFVAFTLERSDPGFRAAGQVESAIGLPCIAMVPMLSGGALRDPLAVARRNGKSRLMFAEAIRMARGAALGAPGKKAPQIIVVTSSVPEEGKSMFAAAFARSIVEIGKSVLLIDGDLRRPRIGELMGIRGGSGLQDVIIRGVSLGEAVRVEAEGGLHILPAGDPASGEHDILETEQMWRFLAECCNLYHTIVIDTPPVMIVSDASAVARFADAVIYVVEWARTPRETVMAGVRKLRSVSNATLRLVLSKVDLAEHAKYQFKDEGYYASVYDQYYQVPSRATLRIGGAGRRA